MLKYLLVLIFGSLFSYLSLAQNGRATGLTRSVFTSATSVQTVNQTTYSWTVGDNIIFTGGAANLHLTQGFLQPMVCKRIPFIVALYQTGCSQPYTLDVGSGFDTYQWKSGTATIATGTAPQYYPVAEGSYHVLVGDSTGCIFTTRPISVDFSLKNPKPTVLTRGDDSGNDTLLVADLTAKSYQWYVVAQDGIHRAIVGANGPYYRPYYNGTYYVRVNTFDNCDAYSLPYTFSNTTLDDMLRYTFEQTDSTIIITPALKITRHKLKVYPIPAPSDFVIDYESPHKNTVMVQLVGADGNLVDVRQVSNKTGKIVYTYRRGDLPVGGYVLQVKDGDHSMVQTLVLE